MSTSRNSRALAIVGCSIVVLLVLWILFRSSETRRESGASGADTDAVPSGVLTGAVNPQASITGTSVKGVPPNDTNLLLPIEAQRKATIERMNVPISFYGLVVDQNNKGISGVKITMSVRQAHYHPELFVTSTHPRHERITDSAGFFSFDGEKGDNLAIENLEKDGYMMSPKSAHSFMYFGASPFNSDANNPVVFRIWKKTDPAQLVVQDKDTRIPYDGTPVTFDLLTGRKNVGLGAAGDLRVSLLRKPLALSPDGRAPFDWEASVEALDGGIVQCQDELMFAAPETGYVPKITISMPKQATNWTSICTVSFYAKTRGGGVYARVRLEFRVDSDKAETGLTITSSANPTGSRNLQP